MSQSVKAPFKFSYTQPSLDWFETINVEIKPDDYYYFKLQRRYGPDRWLIGQNPPPENSTRHDWIEDYRRDREDLRAYKATGLTPEQCENAKAIIESAFSDDTSKAERIRELLKADRDGRLVVLPCKPDGSMLNTSDPERPELMKRIHFAVAYVCGGIVFHQPYNIFLENIAAGYIRPLNEAEKALEAMKNE